MDIVVKYQLELEDEYIVLLFKSLLLKPDIVNKKCGEYDLLILEFEDEQM